MPHLSIDDVGFYCAVFVAVAFGIEIVYNMWNRKK